MTRESVFALILANLLHSTAITDDGATQPPNPLPPVCFRYVEEYSCPEVAGYVENNCGQYPACNGLYRQHTGERGPKLELVLEGNDSYDVEAGSAWLIDCYHDVPCIAINQGNTILSCGPDITQPSQSSPNPVQAGIINYCLPCDHLIPPPQIPGTPGQGVSFDE